MGWFELSGFSGKGTRFCRWESPLRGGHDPMVSVEDAGKLFERIEAANREDTIKGIGIFFLVCPCIQRVFARATEAIGSWMTASQG